MVRRKVPRGASRVGSLRECAELRRAFLRERRGAARASVACGETETINDLDCMVANFWRALQNDPDAVAEAADNPVNEADQHARHLWLCSQEDFRERMKTEPEFYDREDRRVVGMGTVYLDWSGVVRSPATSPRGRRERAESPATSPRERRDGRA